jgi:hypothetical protein
LRLLVVLVQVKCPNIKQEIDACIEGSLISIKSGMTKGWGEGEAGEVEKE